MKKLFFSLFLISSLDTITAASKPNIVLIVADDMGFSDIGCYGSEIPTPNIDALAKGGLRYNQFYNTARCSPTRAALLTGLHPHQAGMGRLAEEAIGKKGDMPDAYLGYLSDHSVTIAEALRPAGYQTIASGKWHLGMRDESKWPLQRGFDRFYGILAGATSYFKPEGNRGLTLENQQINPPSEAGYYTTNAFTDYAIRAVKETKPDAPFFLYLAFNAPHWPLQAPKEDIDKFVGKYRGGWDKLRAARHAKMIQLGIVEKNWLLSERDADARTWDSLSEKQQTDLDYRMAVYAAQIHCMDRNIGRLVETLKSEKKMENTLILFLSDNGGCSEPFTDLGGGEQVQINDPGMSGAISYGVGWANASNTPFRKFKSCLNEGGIATPLIVHWPAGLKTAAGAIDSTPGYLTDIMPTLLEAGSASYPAEHHGQSILPLEGRSLIPSFNAQQKPDNERIFTWEQYGNKAVRVGNLKAVFPQPGKTHGTGKWELFDMSSDRTELNDLAAKRPDELEKLIPQWNAWATRVKVNDVPKDTVARKKGKK